MLRELHIQNLAVIQDITVELSAGLNCFTGQTGAGKSLIIGALEILLGLRQPTDMLRKTPGQTAEGRVSGLFHIASENLRQEIAAATDLPLDSEPELLITRRLHESGRTSASLNGNPITGAMLKHVGEILVDVHGQHDAQFLLKPANQLAVLDEFGGSTDLSREFAELFHQRQTLLGQQQELAASRTLRRQQLELYEFQAREIDDAQLAWVPTADNESQRNEHDQLSARGRVLANLEKIQRNASAAYAALYEDQGAIIERLKATAALLLQLAELDEALSPVATQIKDATVSLDDAAYSLRRYVDRLELDPEELAQVTERLNLLNRLIDKYAGGRAAGHARAGGGLDDVIAYRRQVEAQLRDLRARDHDLSASSEQIGALEKQLQSLGQKLTAARKKAADRLIPLVQAQLADLGMKEAGFLVEFQRVQSDLNPATDTLSQKPKSKTPKSADVSPLSLADFSTASGLESVEFLIAPNPGQPARPLRRIASGGELSRIMLALKSILAQRGGADRVSVLVFDEIDANVGGRMGSIIGEKLRHLASVHQVLCITHLPQIAAFAERHLTIKKNIIPARSSPPPRRGAGPQPAGDAAGDTSTTVTLMTGDARINELAEMTSGTHITPTALAQARELLELAQRTEPVAQAKTRRNSPRPV